MKNILLRIYEFIIKSYILTCNENYIDEYDSYMAIRPRL
tara:strand:+ start:181 stop:297 length:117 start_codon:yes stop_codon:yes gene_type:complete